MIICIISYNYPTTFHTDSIFVKQLVDTFAKQGHECIVVSPYNFLHYKRIISSYWEYFVDDKHCVKVLRPYFLSFSNLHFGKFRVSDWIHDIVVESTLKKLKSKPDIVYGHFWYSAIEGYKYAKQYNIPLFVATGESKITLKLNEKTKAFCEYVKGVICVSTKNKDESVRLGLISESKCKVFPNAIDSQLFKKLNRQDCRNKLKLPQGVFIVAFVGWFSNRKGVLRVSEAINKLSGDSIFSIFIGKGEDSPNCQNILFEGPVQHNKIPEYLNAADVFVLPTLHEGCCNAIIEAMACGLPIISSNLSFNWDVLDETNSIMIDPNNIDEIANAIKILKENKTQRDILAAGSLKKSERLILENRASGIVNFIKNNI